MKIATAAAATVFTLCATAWNTQNNESSISQLQTGLSPSSTGGPTVNGTAESLIVSRPLTINGPVEGGAPIASGTPTNASNSLTRDVAQSTSKVVSDHTASGVSASAHSSGSNTTTSTETESGNISGGEAGAAAAGASPSVSVGWYPPASGTADPSRINRKPTPSDTGKDPISNSMSFSSSGSGTCGTESSTGKISGNSRANSAFDLDLAEDMGYEPTLQEIIGAEPGPVQVSASGPNGSLVPVSSPTSLGSNSGGAFASASPVGSVNEIPGGQLQGPGSGSASSVGSVNETRDGQLQAPGSGSGSLVGSVKQIADGQLQEPGVGSPSNKTGVLNTGSESRDPIARSNRPRPQYGASIIGPQESSDGPVGPGVGSGSGAGAGPSFSSSFDYDSDSDSDSDFDFDSYSDSGYGSSLEPDSGPWGPGVGTGYGGTGNSQGFLTGSSSTGPSFRSRNPRSGHTSYGYESEGADYESDSDDEDMGSSGPGMSYGEPDSGPQRSGIGFPGGGPGARYQNSPPEYPLPFEGSASGRYIPAVIITIIAGTVAFGMM